MEILGNRNAGTVKDSAMESLIDRPKGIQVVSDHFQHTVQVLRPSRRAGTCIEDDLCFPKTGRSCCDNSVGGFDENTFLRSSRRCDRLLPSRFDRKKYIFTGLRNVSGKQIKRGQKPGAVSIRSCEYRLRSFEPCPCGPLRQTPPSGERRIYGSDLLY